MPDLPSVAVGQVFRLSSPRKKFKLIILECVKHDHRELWMQYFDGNKKPLLDELSRLDYTASLDFPIIAIFDDLLEVLRS